jgi:hypothetical protein
MEALSPAGQLHSSCLPQENQRFLPASARAARVDSDSRIESIQMSKCDLTFYRMSWL